MAKILCVLILFTLYAQSVTSLIILCEFKRINDYTQVDEPHHDCSIKAEALSENIDYKFIDEVIFADLSIENVSNLSLHAKNMTKIPENFSTFFPLVTKLEISSSNLEELTQDDVKNLRNLVKLQIKPSNVKVLHADLFAFNKDFVSFRLIDANQLESVHPQLIDNLPSIKSLTVSGKCIENSYEPSSFLQEYWDMVASRCFYPDTVYCVYQINTDINLYYSCNVEEIIKVEFKDSLEVFGYHKFNKTDSDVQELEIRSSNLYLMPDYLLDKFMNLKVVKIRGNLIVLGVQSFKHLEKLEELYLPGNKVDFINSDAFKFNKNLKRIDLGDSPMSYIGVGAFWTTKNLEMLNIGANSCLKFRGTGKKEIENFFNNQKKFNCFRHDALYCRFYESTLSFVGKVYTCSGRNYELLNENKFIRMFLTAFGDHLEGFSHDQVEALKIQNYKLAKDFKLNEDFPNLSYIEISNSNLQQVSNGMFGKFNNLKFLDLSFNKLKGLPAQAFKNNPNLIFLNLEGNYFHFIFDQVSTLSKLQFLKFESFCYENYVKGTFEITNILNGECVDLETE